MTLLALTLISSMAAVDASAQKDIDACRATADATACSHAALALLKEDLREAGELALKGCATDSKLCAVLNVQLALNEANRIEDGLQLLEKACDQQYIPACLAGGTARLDGSEQVFREHAMSEVPVRQDIKRGTAMLEKACSADDSNACFALELAYKSGKHVPADPARARRYEARFKELSAKQQEAANATFDAMDAEAVEQLERAAKRNAPRVPGWEKECTEGKAPSCLLLGSYYELSDPKKALEYRVRASQLHPGSATVDLLTWGQRVGRKDPAAGAEIYARACEASDAACCGIGGVILVNQLHRGPEGMKLLEKGCALDDEASCTSAANHYRVDPDFKNPARATEFERRAKSIADARVAREKKADHDRAELERQLRPLDAELERLEAENNQRYQAMRELYDQRKVALDAAEEGKTLELAPPVDSPDTREIRRDLIHRMAIDLGLAGGAGGGHAFPEAENPQRAIDCRNTCSASFTSCLEGCDKGPEAKYDACFEACGSNQQTCSSACPTISH